MSSLGIYFGQKVNSIIEAKGKAIINSIHIPVSMLPIQPEDKVPEEVKLVALFKDELRKKKIETKEATITLSSADLIVRNFDIPILPSAELANAINFEAKKYIPFKIDELVTNHQVRLNQAIRRYSVLFIGIKKDTLEKYISILRQLNLKVSSVEYSAFSILRLINLSGLKDRGVIGVINIDTQEEKESDFTVIENGFPLFTRDIKLSNAHPEPDKAEEEAPVPFERLKTELRISLDYYHRKFPLKKISQILLIGNPAVSIDVEAFIRELGLPFKLVDLSKVAAKLPVFSLSLLKAYSSAIAKVVKSPVQANILLAWEKIRPSKEPGQSPLESVFQLFSDFKLDARVIILAGLICASGFAFGMYQKMPLQKELNSLVASRPKVSNLSPQATNEELNRVQGEFKNKLSVMDNLVKKQLYLTPCLSNLPGLIPEGMWLKHFSFIAANKKTEFSLNGMVYLKDDRKELEAVNNLLLSFKNDPEFSKIFKQLRIVSIDVSKAENKTVTNFTILGLSQEEDKNGAR